MLPTAPQFSRENGHLSTDRRPRGLVRSKRIARTHALQEIQNRVMDRSPEPGRAEVLKAANAVRKSGRSAPQLATPELVDLYRKQAAAFPEVRHDDERIAAYIAHRINGSDIPHARKDCQYGLYYLRCSQAKREQIEALLDEYGVSTSPMCWPRHELRLDQPLEKCPLLDDGSSNKIHAIRHNGQDYSFQPFRSFVDQIFEPKPTISSRGELLGLQSETYFPGLPRLAAGSVAAALGLLGKDGVIGAAWVAIINGVPGILEQRAWGRMEARRSLRNEKLSANSPVGRMAADALKAGETQLDRLQAVHALGLVHAVREKDSVRLTGNLGQRSKRAAQRYAASEYKVQMLRAQVFACAVNVANLDPEHIRYERRGANQFSLKLVGINEAFAPSHAGDIDFEDSDDAWELAGMAMPISSMPVGMREVLRSERCQDIVSSLCRDLKGFLPPPDLEAFAARMAWLRTVELPELDASHAWQPGDTLDPTRYLLDSVIGFSSHSFGDSADSDSSDDEESAPEARALG
jgi:hypothetical protein